MLCTGTFLNIQKMCHGSLYIGCQNEKKFQRNASVFYHYDLFIALLTGAMLDDWRIITIRHNLEGKHQKYDLGQLWFKVVHWFQRF